MDEPLSNLDAKLRGTMRQEISRLQRELRNTTVYVTHDQIEAMTLADRIVILHDGVIQQVGPPLEVYRRPTNRFVAGFIGSPSMNFLEVEVEVVDEGDGRTLRAPGVTVPLPPALGHRLDAFRGGNLILGFRPQDVELAVNGDGRFCGRVDTVETYGSETYINLVLDGSDARVAARLPPTVEVAADAALQLTAPDESLFFFDPHTEAAIY